MKTQDASKSSFKKPLSSTKTGISDSVPILVTSGSDKFDHSIVFFKQSIDVCLQAHSSDFTSYCCVFDVIVGGSMVESHSHLMRAYN